MTLCRREFLKHGLLSSAYFLAPFCAATGNATQKQKHDKSTRSLVLIQLCGGNDGHNSLLPYGSTAYYDLRPGLALNSDSVAKLDQDFGLHPALNPLHQFYGTGELALVQGVGYPFMSSSHFQATSIWQSGLLGSASEHGWIGRYLDTVKDKQMSTKTEAICLDRAMQQVFSAQNSEPLSTPFFPSAEDSAFKESVDLIFAMIKKQSTSTIYGTALSGFDTHRQQKEKHAHLLATLAINLHSLYLRLKKEQLHKNVLIMVYSEFSRQAEENASAGTEHGGAGTVFLLGGSLKGGITGKPDYLEASACSQRNYLVDFRAIYAEIIDRFLGGAESSLVLRERFQHCGFLAS